MHFFLAPHLDDAVLSCGGLIYDLCQAGDPVTVYTVMAGGVLSDVPISPFVAEHFERWQLGPNPVPGRKIEETRAVQLLGGTVQFGAFPDALYRTDGKGKALYPDLTTLFGTVNPHDPVLDRQHIITDPLTPALTIYAPLGIGNHVDHQLVRNAVAAWHQTRPQVAVFFYEEYPYSADGADVVQAARSTLAFSTVPVLHQLSNAALKAKIEAIACYQSQISTFWDDVPAMAKAVRHHAVEVGSGTYAERLWQPV